jgi:hypothetical protein
VSSELAELDDCLGSNCLMVSIFYSYTWIFFRHVARIKCHVSKKELINLICLFFLAGSTSEKKNELN